MKSCEVTGWCAICAPSDCLGGPCQIKDSSLQASTHHQLPQKDPALPVTDLFIQQKIMLDIQHSSTMDGFYLFFSFFLIRSGCVVGAVAGWAASFCVSPGNIWNRSAGWPDFTLPRLTATHTEMVLTLKFLPLSTLSLYSVFFILHFTFYFFSSLIYLATPYMPSLLISIRFPN